MERAFKGALTIYDIPVRSILLLRVIRHFVRYLERIQVGRGAQMKPLIVLSRKRLPITYDATRDEKEIEPNGWGKPPRGACGEPTLRWPIRLEYPSCNAPLRLSLLFGLIHLQGEHLTDK